MHLLLLLPIFSKNHFYKNPKFFRYRSTHYDPYGQSRLEMLKRVQKNIFWILGWRQIGFFLDSL